MDIGTGSGAIAITLLVTIRRRGAAGEVTTIAIDRSPEALDLARENAVGHAVADGLSFLEADLLPPVVVDPYDIVVANLPYVRSDAIAGLPIAASFEPVVALDGGPTGSPSSDGSSSVCRRPWPRAAWRSWEIGADQGEAIVGLVGTALPGWRVAVLADLAGLPRVARIERPA